MRAHAVVRIGGVTLALGLAGLSPRPVHVQTRLQREQVEGLRQCRAAGTC